MTSDTQPSPSQSRATDQGRQATDATLAALLKVDDSTILELTKLTLPEIRAIKEEIARVFPAGKLPAFVLSGLLKLRGRRLNSEQVNRDLAALLQGLDLTPKWLLGALVVGPATVLHAYQKLLQLAGKDLDSAFPEGTWQFYLQFGLREDTARHANETIGFHTAFPEHRDPIPGAAAWIRAALELLYTYDDLLLTDWTERVMLRLLVEEATKTGIADQAPFATLVRDWGNQCPYHHPPDGSDYLLHRQSAFQQFLQGRLRALPAEAQRRFRRRYEVRMAKELPIYQRQMTLLATLEPDRYQEHKRVIPFWRAAIAFVWQGRTYLLPVCERSEQGSPLCYPIPEKAAPLPLYVLPEGGLCDARSQPLQVDRSGRVYYHDGRLLGVLRPPRLATILSWVAAIFATPTDASADSVPPSLDLLLAETPRSLQPQLRDKLPAATQKELEKLRRASIVINWDRHAHDLPLAYIRRGQRGIGDHALTVFRTGHSFVFDQSHIFFDGMWGMAVAEVLTDSATHWYRRLIDQPFTSAPAPPQPLRLVSSPQAEIMAHPQRQLREVSAESGEVNFHRLERLRKWLGQRGARLTVNDLLLLYRFFHAADYEPSPQARQALDAFCERVTSSEAGVAWQAIETTLARLRQTNPALLIPMDASNVSPGERVFPTTFRNPLVEIRDRFTTTQEHYHMYRDHPGTNTWQEFDKTRRELLAYLKAFGELMDATKAVTMRGESFNTAIIRLLAHLPPSMQHLIDGLPQRVGALNEIVKGNEVFSNVGRVAPGSTITRFISAKDDGETKELIWGVITDDQNQLRISLRDFRPFVPQLLALGEEALANLLAHDYLQTYVDGFNHFVDELRIIVTARVDEQEADSG